jgi:hypothetical protein
MPEFEDIATNDGTFQNIRKNVVRDRLNGTKIRIGGTNFAVGIKSRVLERFKVAGQTDFFNDTILLEANLTEANTLVTVLHEIIECISRKYYLDLPHELINGLETYLFDALVNNPNILQELLIYAKKLNNDKRTKESKTNKK